MLNHSFHRISLNNSGDSEQRIVSKQQSHVTVRGSRFWLRDLLETLFVFSMFPYFPDDYPNTSHGVSGFHAEPGCKPVWMFSGTWLEGLHSKLTRVLSCTLFVGQKCFLKACYLSTRTLKDHGMPISACCNPFSDWLLYTMGKLQAAGKTKQPAECMAQR